MLTILIIVLGSWVCWAVHTCTWTLVESLSSVACWRNINNRSNNWWPNIDRVSRSNHYRSRNNHYRNWSYIKCCSVNNTGSSVSIWNFIGSAYGTWSIRQENRVVTSAWVRWTWCVSTLGSCVTWAVNAISSVSWSSLTVVASSTVVIWCGIGVISASYLGRVIIWWIIRRTCFASSIVLETLPCIACVSGTSSIIVFCVCVWWAGNAIFSISSSDLSVSTICLTIVPSKSWR